MAKLLMITGLGSAADLASGKKGAFYNTLEEFHKYWERIDIIAPKIKRQKSETKEFFGNVFVHISPWPLIFHPLWFLKKGLEIFKKQKFDLMTVHEFPPFYNGTGARLLWQKIKVPYVLEIFHVPGHPRTAGFREAFYRFLFKLFIRFDASKAKAVRVMNQKQVPDFLIQAGVPQEKIVYIPAIYADYDIFSPKDITKKYDLIFVGRLEKNKGIDLFLDAVKKLNCEAVIVGDGSLANDVKLKIENWKQPSEAEQWPIWPLKIDMHGWAKDSQEIAELINKSKVMLMPSYNEGGPRVVLEAMACGVPVLATPVGIVPDLGPAIIQIDWNSDDIAKKASRVLNNELEYVRLRRDGLEIAKQFEKKEAIKNYADKLKEILG